MKWDQNNPEKVKDFIAKMKQDYAFKKAYAARRAWEFYNHPDVAGMCYVAVGGLDSITLFLFLRSIGIEVPGTSVSMLEDRSIQKVHNGRRYAFPFRTQVRRPERYRRPVLPPGGAAGPAPIRRRARTGTPPWNGECPRYCWHGGGYAYSLREYGGQRKHRQEPA